MKLTLQNEKRLAMLTELLKLCKYFVLYYPFPNIIIIIQHNNWQISIFGLYFFCYPVLSGGVLLALWEKIFTDKFARITSPLDTWPPPVYAFYAKQWLDIQSKNYTLVPFTNQQVKQKIIECINCIFLEMLSLLIL